MSGEFLDVTGTRHPLNATPTATPETHPTTRPRNVLEIDNLHFSYPDVGDRSVSGNVDPLLRIQHLAARSSEILVLIGDNGCGKTTLLKLMAGLLVPGGGSIERLGHGRAAQTTIPILVHQRPYLFAESVFANVAWPLKIRRVPRSEVRRRSLAALREVGLEKLARRWAPSLSGGEKQRAAIARALVLDPAVLLLDEPTSNIDAASIATVERVLRKLAAQNKTVIMSTHNLASAYRLADRIVPMQHGRPAPMRVNILKGYSLDPGEEHIGRFQVQDGPQIYCPAVAGHRTTAVVRMDDIILSRAEVATSAQNHLQGVVRAVELSTEELARVEVDCDGCTLTAMVTHRSVDEFDLRSGSELWATFKASAVELY